LQPLDFTNCRLVAVKGAGHWMRGETAREAIIRGKMKIDEAAHDTEGMSL